MAVNPVSLRNLRPYPKGVSGNPTGINGIPENLRHIKNLTQPELTKIVSKYARMVISELQKAIKDPTIPVLELSIASIFNKSIQHGDYTRLAFLLERAVGKVPTIVEDEAEFNERAELAKLSMNELLTLVKTTLPEIQNDQNVVQIDK